MLTKDFLKQILTEEKKLVEIKEISMVKVPFYDELSVKKFYPIMCGDDNFMQYMPDPTPENRLPERTFFWNAANTLDRPYVRMLVLKASEKRMGANSEINEAKKIEISEEWLKKLCAGTRSIGEGAAPPAADGPATRVTLPYRVTNPHLAL